MANRFMAIKFRIILLCAASAFLLTACGSSDTRDTADHTDDTPAEVVESEDLYEVDDEDAPSDGTLSPITPSDYLVSDFADYVTLSDYEDLSAEQYEYTITDEMVQEEVQASLEEFGEEKDTGAPAADGDYVYMNLTSTISGSSESTVDEDYYIVLGAEEMGSEFDEQIKGLSEGDSKEFSVTFDEEIWDADWEGQTVDFKVEITAVTALELPEYNDDFVSENTSFDTVDEFEDYLRTYLEQYYIDMSYSGVIEDLLAQAINETTFDGYPEDLYESCRSEILSGYTIFADDDTSLDEILEMFGVTDEMIEDEVKSLVYRRLFVSAYCGEHDLTVTEEDYVAYVEQNAEYYDFLDPADFEEQYTRETLVWNLYESLVAADLYEKAEITTVDYEEEEVSELDLSELESLEDLEEIDLDELESIEFETE